MSVMHLSIQETIPGTFAKPSAAVTLHVISKQMVMYFIMLENVCSILYIFNKYMRTRTDPCVMPNCSEMLSDSVLPAYTILRLLIGTPPPS